MKRAWFLLLLLAVVAGACSSTETSLEGSVIFANNCATCHADDLRGTARAPTLDAGTEFATHSDVDYAEAIRSGPKTMPSFQNLSDAQVAAVISYLRQLQSE